MAEVLVGTAKKNKLTAAKDKTQVYGLAGNDTLTSNGKSDVLLIGGSGKDSLKVTGGSATLSGGKGADTFNLTYSADNKLSAVIEDIDATDKIIITNADKTSAKLKHYILGDDVIWTDAKGYFNLTLKGSSDASDYYEGTADENIWDVLRITNQERENEGLSPLVLSQGLTDGASIRATELVISNSHTRPDGTSCFTVLEKSYRNVGENIAGGQNSPEEVMTAWMNSPGHRANILTENFKKLGVGYYYDSDSTYKYNWVQMFGSNLTSPDTVAATDILKSTITLNNAAFSGKADAILIKGTSGADNFRNTLAGATIQALGGKDTVYNESPNVSVDGGAGNDYLYNYEGSFVTLSGGKGNDTIRSLVESVTINGGAGNDSIYNDGSAVSIIGGAGNDSISNSNKNVTIDGGTGNDYLYNGGGLSSTVTIGDKEIIYSTEGGSKVTISGGKGNDKIINRGDNVKFNYASGDGNDSIVGFKENSTLSISGGWYSTTQSGSDIIVTVGEGKITLQGAASLSKLNIKGTKGLTLTNSDSSPVTIDSSIQVVDASTRTKAIKITGNKLANTISGGTKNDSLYGGKGNDSIVGNAGNDKLLGQAGNDILVGGAGNDSLWGGAGNDSLFGGDGNDVFIYKPNEGTDKIFDYQSGDMLKILKSNGKAGGTFDSATFSGGELTLAISGGGSVIFENVSKGDKININGTSYIISGKTLK